MTDESRACASSTSSVPNGPCQAPGSQHAAPAWPTKLAAKRRRALKKSPESEAVVPPAASCKGGLESHSPELFPSFKSSTTRGVTPRLPKGVIWGSRTFTWFCLRCVIDLKPLRTVTSPEPSPRFFRPSALLPKRLQAGTIGQKDARAEVLH